MKNYHNLLNEVLETGTRQANRTGIDAISIPGAMLKFDLTQGFPAITTKKLAFKSMCGELVGFLRGADSAAQFRELGCGFWDQNANENQAWLANPNREGVDDLGRVYGVQWRDWKCADGSSIDQVMNALLTIHKRPTDRRIIINAWRPDEFDQMALPPCHVMYQFLVNVEKKELNLCMYQRSCDLFLGVPMNIASASLFLEIMAHLTGYTARHFTHFMADAHIYVNHIDQVREQLCRLEHHPPRLAISPRIPRYDGRDFDPTWIDRIEPSDFTLVGYQHHDAIKAPMAV
ncbi:MAG: thymidylate synthase [Betaproteobacteria bacterium]|nr:thymidylate synthase [Betaproteobacteria bacterium]